MSSDKSDLLDDESDDDGSDYGSSGTCFFLLRFDDSVGHVSLLGSGVFVPTRVKSKCDVFEFVVFMPIVVEPKRGQLIEIFGAQIPDFCSKFQNQFIVIVMI